MVAVQVILRIQRELRQHDGAVKPEPGVTEYRQENGTITTRKTEIAHHFREWIPVDLQLWRRRRRQRYGKTGEPSKNCKADGHKGDGLQSKRLLHHEHGAQYLAQQNADKVPISMTPLPPTSSCDFSCCGK